METDRETEIHTGIAYAICSLNDIPSQKARGFQLEIIEEDGTRRPFPVVIVRWGKQAFAYHNRCPHDGVNLDWERNTFLDPNYGIRLMCGKHGAQFELGTGLCVEGPCKGRSLRQIGVKIMDGDICLTGITLAEEEDEEDEVPCDDAENG